MYKINNRNWRADTNRSKGSIASKEIISSFDIERSNIKISDLNLTNKEKVAIEYETAYERLQTER